MAKKTDELKVLLAELQGERDALEAAIEAMIGEMADAPVEQRQSGDWAPDGASTWRYLEQSGRLAEVEQAVVDVSREIAAAGKPSG
ncbi:MAG: hypothetical protein P8Z80_08325 [Pseudolabrys sp.]|jgi:hypothetical protein